jgi:hypothetical protein
MLVHSQMPNAESKIKAFRNTDKRWNRVRCDDFGRYRYQAPSRPHLPTNALTELAFRQAIGRVVRSAGPTDDTRACVVMPSFETFEEYARRSKPRCRQTRARMAKSLRDKSAARYAKPKTNYPRGNARAAAISFRERASQISRAVLLVPP